MDEALGTSLALLKDDGKALAKIAKKQAERSALQKDIAALCKARASYVTEARKKLATDGGDTLGQAKISAIRAQTKSHNSNYVAK